MAESLLFGKFKVGDKVIYDPNFGWDTDLDETIFGAVGIIISIGEKSLQDLYLKRYLFKYDNYFNVHTQYAVIEWVIDDIPIDVFWYIDTSILAFKPPVNYMEITRLIVSGS